MLRVNVRRVRRQAVQSWRRLAVVSGVRKLRRPGWPEFDRRRNVASTTARSPVPVTLTSTSGLFVALDALESVRRSLDKAEI